MAGLVLKKFIPMCLQTDDINTLSKVFGWSWQCKNAKQIVKEVKEFTKFRCVPQKSGQFFKKCIIPANSFQK